MAEEHEEPKGIVIDELIIRRSELDDAHTINEIISVEENSCLDQLYNYPKVLRLMETSYLSVTIMDRDENILGCLVFDSSHDIITGMNDYLHENLWEDWLYSVFNIEREMAITPYNSLWLRYVFIAKGIESMDEPTEVAIIERVFRFVYNTMPELDFIMFHLRKEASSSTKAREFISPMLQSVFFALERKDLPPEAKEYLNLTSEIYVSDRSRIIKVLEIRDALEQDHDDLVEICNTQSKLDTEHYGQYFIAELIANQTENRKAIVAQVDAKAKGLLSLSTDIDYGFLSKNFELENYDNLCNSDYMDAVRQRRAEEEVESRIAREAEKRRFDLEKHDAKILCSDIANRIILQQYCIDHQVEIKKWLEDTLAEESKKRNVYKRNMEEEINRWLRDFKITQPGSFFDQHPTLDPEIYGHIISEKDFFLDTLTYFGLPPNYINGNGQWKDYYKIAEEKKKADERRNKFMNGPNSKKPKKTKKGEEDPDMKKPDYFDLNPLIEAFRNFVDTGPEVRTRIRILMKEDHKRITQLFCHPNGEQDDNKKQDILNIANNINTEQFQENQVEGFGWVLECFGGCTYEKFLTSVPEKQKEETAEMRALKQNNATKAKPRKDAQQKFVDKILKMASYSEFKSAVEKMTEFDETLMRHGKIVSETLKKDVKEKEEEYQKRIQKQITLYREQVPPIDNPYYQMISNKTEEEIMRQVPKSAQNAVAVNIFFIDKLFESRSIDFLPYAFQKFPQAEYIILTQPFEAEESVLLQSFISVPKKENTNITHTLYIYHRACLMSPYLTVRKSNKDDVEQGSYLLEGASNEKEFKTDLIDAITNNASNKISFSAFNQNAVIGFFVLTKDVNMEYYKSHFCIQYYLLLDQYALTDHSRLLHSVVNPLFQRARRFLFREIMRLSNKKTLLFETTGTSVTLPDCFNDMTLVARRTFPHFLERKWDLEKDEEYMDKVRDPIPSQDRDRIPIDEEIASFGLSLISKRMLSVNKVNNNTRIVVVGASDTGISFIEYLLGLRYINFTNITLLSPGGLFHYHLRDGNPFYQLKAQSINYSLDELRSLMLDARITIVNGSMTSFDRKMKTINVIDHQNKKLVLNYDTLVICVGLVDNTFKEIYREKAKENRDSTQNFDISNYRHIYSIDDPYIYRIFKKEEQDTNSNPTDPVSLMTHKKRPQKINIFGRSINCLSFASGLIARGVKPNRINLVIPPMTYKHKESFESNHERIDFEDNKLNDLDAFDGDAKARGKTLEILKSLGITVYEDFHFVDILPDESDPNKMKGIKLRNDKNDKPEEALGSILVTAGVLDIEERLFDTIQENGLVYNGRLIVKNNFETVDPKIFACGKVVEFSQQYKNFALGRSLRLDRYSGRELGQKLGQCVLEALGIMAKTLETDPKYETLPSFEMPVGVCAYLPNNLMYIRVSSLQEGLPDQVIKTKQNRHKIMSDNLNKGQGHYLEFTFDNNGLVKGVVYLGTEPIQVASLVSLVGLSETYLNKLIERHADQLIDNITEFLSENWAIALYHQWFSEFRFNLKQKLVDNPDLAKTMDEVTNEAITAGGFLNRDLIAKRLSDIPENFRQVIRDDALQFIRDNMNHLPMYYVPGTEFK